MVALGLIACALFAFALISRRVEGTVVTVSMAFVAAGLICGWTGLVDFGSAAHGGDHAAPREVVFLVAELALVPLLFTDAARIDPRVMRSNPCPGHRPAADRRPRRAHRAAGAHRTRGMGVRDRRGGAGRILVTRAPPVITWHAKSPR